MQTTTPLSLLTLPSKDALVQEFVGRDIRTLRTPALIVDRNQFRRNCERVTGETEKRGMGFRAHVKTHKAAEGIRIQVEASKGVRALIASTLPEVWQIIHSGVVQEGKVDDILYSMPISIDKLDEIVEAQESMGGKGVMRLMVDHASQIEFLDAYEANREGKWSVFIKIDGGGKRAGCPPDSQQMKDLLSACQKSDSVDIFGFYSHFGQSYASKSLDKATEFYHSEIECVNQAAKLAKSMGLSPSPSGPSSKGSGSVSASGEASSKWTLSVGATPTAHAATQIRDGEMDLEGVLELHAGCYCMLDIQQLATSLISHSDISISILSRVVSTYPLRKEAMCDAGALAVSKDTGPLAGYGHVVWPESLRYWDLGRISQEHGTLVRRAEAVGRGEGEGRGGGGEGDDMKIGDLIRIVPQHACLACASYPWFYVVEDGGEEVVDVWVPCKGW